MSKGTGVYRKSHSIAEINFSLPLAHTHATNPVRELILRIGDIDVEVLVKNAFFRKTDGTGTAVTLQVDIYELPTQVEDGTEFTGFLKADKDRTKGFYDLEDITFYEGFTTTTFDDDINIFRSGGVASKGVVTYNTEQDFKYFLRRNTDYLISSEVLDGLTNTSETILYGEVIVARIG